MTTAAQPPRLPQATLAEEFAVASVQRWALAMGRRPTVPATAAALAGEPAVAAPAPSGDRAARRAEALLRLAMDGRTTAHERALAAARAAEYLRASA